MAAGLTLYTIGHGTAAIADFVAALQSAQIEDVVDVRRYPVSRRHPQFNADALAQSLNDANIGYRNAIDLGGRRAPDTPTRNPGLRDAGFRGYADYMQTETFARAFTALLQQSEIRRTAILCSETLWWRCHRRLISDAVVLLAQRRVEHIVGGVLHAHVPTEGVRRVGDRLYYGVGPLGV